MLEHQKIVLKGVSYSKDLFEKELLKSLRWISSDEQRQLEEWVKENFIHMHAEIIQEIFDSEYNVAS